MKAAESIGKAVSNDIVVIRGQHFRKVVIEKAQKKTKTHPAKEEVAVLVPVDYELHVNPVAIGLGALGIGVAALAGIVAWNGIHVGVVGIGDVTIFPGIKDAPATKKYLENRAELARQKADCEAAGGRWNPITKKCDLGTSASCARLKAEYDAARAEQRYTDASRAAYQARYYGCAWAR